MAATLADVNATLGVTNIALSSVVAEQKETNKGITAFVDFIRNKDADDSRRALEDKRESKPVLKSIGAGAATVGGGLVSAGKSTFGFGKGLLSKLSVPAGFVGGFLTSLLSSKLLRLGLAGLGVYFGDEIAEYLLGDDAKDEVKEAFGNVIKGASIGGFLFGKKGFIIGGALTALLQNKKVDDELGRLTTNIDEFAKKIGFKDGLLGIVQKIGDAVGTGLQGLNDLAEGKVNFKSVSSTLGLLGGAAFLVSPRGSAKLAVAAGLALAKSPAGRILMALAGLAYAGSNIFGDDTKGSNPEIDKKMGINEAKPQGGDVGGLSKYFTLDNIIGATTVGLLATSLKDLATGGINLLKKFNKFGKATDGATDAIRVMQNANKGPGALARMFGLLKSGAKGAFGLMTSATGATILLPLAAVGITEALFGDDLREENEQNKQKQNALKSSGITTEQGKEFFTGTRGFMEDFQFDANNPKSFIGANKFSDPGMLENLDEKYRKKYNTVSNISKLVPKNLVETSMKGFEDFVPPPPPINNSGNVVSTNTVNSGNTYNSTGFAINNSGAFDLKDMLSRQINPTLTPLSGLF